MMLANIALPAFLPHSLATLLGIFAIAAIEGWLLMYVLKLNYADSYRHALVANWNSTIVGIPLAWLLWIAGLVPVSMGLSALGIESHPALQSTLTQSAVFGGVVPTEWTNVGSAAAWSIMLVPFFLGSIWIERRTIRRRLPDCDQAQLSKAVVLGNLASYSLFAIIGVIGLSNALADLPNQKIRFEEFRERQKQYRGEQSGGAIRQSLAPQIPAGHILP